MSRTVAWLLGLLLVVAAAASPFVVGAGRDGEVLAAWLAAIGTVGTLGYALWQIADERERRRLSGEREQADRVAAWCTGTENVDGQALVVDVCCRNASHLPVHDVALVVYPDGDWRNSRVSVKRDDLGAVGPGCTTSVPVRFDGPLTHDLGRHTPVAVEFTDARSRRWIRTPDGILEERK